MNSAKLLIVNINLQVFNKLIKHKFEYYNPFFQIGYFYIIFFYLKV